MLTESRAREIVATVESQHKAFRSLDCTVIEGKAFVHFKWFDRPALTAVNSWFTAAGACPLLTGRVLVDGEYLVDYGVIRFTEAA
jgi:hypothetical protein